MTLVFGTIGLVLVVLFLSVVAWHNRTAIGRLMTAGSAQLAKVGREAEEADSIAVMQLKRDQAAEQVKNAVEAMGDCRGHIESLTRQVATGKNEKSRIDVKIRSALNVGDRDRAAQYAMQLQRETDDLAMNEGQLTKVRASYDANMRRVKAAQAAIADVDDRARRLKMELTSSEVEKRLGDLLSKATIGVDTGGIAEAERAAQRQIDRNRGAALVRMELGAEGMNDIESQERERREAADAILAKYEAESK